MVICAFRVIDSLRAVCMVANKSLTAVVRRLLLIVALKLGTAMAGLANVTKNQVSDVMSEFITMAEDQTALGVGNDDYIRNVLVNALGSDKASGVIDRQVVRLVYTKRERGGHLHDMHSERRK